MKYLKMLLRIILMMIVGIILLPFYPFITIYWLYICIKAAKLVNGSVKDGLLVFLQYIKTGLKMNKDFIINGF